jgi:diadenosine tetraphosphate (Ap4A) HIT family hydrolase
MGCAISDGSMSVPGGFVYRTHYFCVHQDPLIPLPGFLVIASTRHIQSIAEMEETGYGEFTRLIKDSHTAIKEVTRVEYLTLVQEESSSHFHLWFFPWAQELIERYGNPSLSKIREIMADYKTGTIGKTEWDGLERSIEAIKTRMTQA